MRLPQVIALCGFICLALCKGLKCFLQEAPKFIQEPPSMVEFISKVGFELNCTATGTPRPVIQWECQGIPCSTISNLRIVHETSITFLPFKPHAFRPDIHDTTYKCVVRNSFGTLVKDVGVKAFVPQIIEPRVGATRALRDYPTLLRCEFPSDVASVSTWLRDEVYKLVPNESNHKYLILPDGHLLIWQVSSQDFYSKFQCRVREKLSGQEYLSSEGRILLQNLEELNRPIIRHLPQNVIVEENQMGVIPCIAMGNPKPIIQWYKKISGGPLLPVSSSFDDMRYDLSNKIQIRQGVLTIPTVRKSHAGIYFCNTSNSFGTDQREVKLSVKTSLTLNLTPQSLTVDMGKTAEFSCTSNDDTIQIEWLKDGVLLRPGSMSGRLRFLRDHKIEVSHVIKEDQDSKPVLLYTFIDQTVVPGTVISVRCKATGWPLPQVNWYLDGFPLPQSERFTVGQYVTDDLVTSYINITSVSTSDSGEYTCQFRNKAGEVIHSNQINVYGELLIRSMGEVVAVFGKFFKIKCPLGGYPIDSIVWSKSGTKLPNSVHQKVSPNGLLTLENVVRTDAGTYQCTAFRQSQTVHGFVEVTVVVLPSITPFQFGDPVQGQRVTVLCSLTTDLKNISIQWYKDNYPINDTGNSHFKITSDEFTSTLTINPVCASQQGNYTCKISSLHSQHISAAWTSPLNVNVPPRITKFNFEDSIVEGMKVQALCFSQGDLPLKFKWYRDEGSSIVSQEGFVIASFGENSEIFTISNVTVDMSGIISCQVSNRGGSAIHSAQLVVKVPPKFIVEPSDVSASSGTLLKLRCEADGKPEPRVKWLQEIRSGHTDYREIENTPGIRNLNGTLIFNHLSKDYSALFFICQASNDVGPPISKRIKLTVTAPPRIRPRQGKEIVEIGQLVTLRCLVDGDLPVIISWKLNGNDLTHHQTKTNDSFSELIIPKVQEKDHGDYTCLAVNNFGHDFTVISLLVQEQPQSPINLRSLKQTSRSVTLAWSIVAYTNVYVLDFIIRYRESGRENWTTEFVSGDQSMVTVVNLTPYTPYEFSLLARNQVGTSQPSGTLAVMTLEEEPTPPRHLTVEETQGRHELKVSWVIPEYPNGVITHYTIFYHKNSDGSGVKHRNVPGSRRNITLRGVENFAQYIILVRAVNVAGAGENSTQIQIQTREGRPKYSPQEVRCEGLSWKSLQITWKPPRFPHNGIIIGYRVNVDLIDEEKHMNSELESEVTGVSTVIQGLREFSRYSVQVIAFTSEGSGPQSCPQFCETKEGFPTEPTDLKVIEHPGYVILAWFYPERLNETLRMFHIYVRTINEGQIMKKTVPPNIMHYELRHMLSDQVYEACVTAENIKGEGKSSRPVTFKIPRLETKPYYHATILSFGQIINIRWKSDLVLNCRYTSLSKVSVIWKRDNLILPQRNDTLHLRNINIQDSGNYTCILTEREGSPTYQDQITHVVNVLVPPNPPVLEAKLQTGNSSTILYWKVGRSNCCRILGFSLNYRQVGGEWEEEIGIEKKQSSYEFVQKECFSKAYQVFLTAYNKIGSSLPSETIHIQVEGYFVLPTYATTIDYNSTIITLNFLSWNIFECDNGILIAEYKAIDETYWILASRTNLSQVIYLKGLPSDKDYHVRVRVQSGDSEISKEFTVPFSQFSLLSENFSKLYRDATVIIPMGLGLVAISSAIGGIVIFWWRRRKEMKSLENPGSSAFNSYAMQDKGERDYTIIREKDLRASDHVPEDADDINPYATFDMHQTLRSCQNPHLETFYGHENHVVLAPDENDYGYRHRRSRSRSGNIRCRDSSERDHYKYDNPNSSSVFCGDEATTMVVTDKQRKSLPRSRHIGLRYGPESSNTILQKDMISQCYVEHSRLGDDGSISQLSGANLVARKVKRRKPNPDGYTCPQDYMFINV